nr:hypothetical protein [Bacteroidia bacterium]
RKYHEIRKMIKRISTLMFLPALVFMVLTRLFSEYIITLFYGIEYLPATDSFKYFIIGATTATVTFWMLPLVQSLGLIKARLIIYALTIVFGVSLSVILVPAMQSAGMAMVLLMINLLNLLLFGYLVRKKMNEFSIGAQSL